MDREAAVLVFETVLSPKVGAIEVLDENAGVNVYAGGGAEEVMRGGGALETEGIGGIVVEGKPAMVWGVGMTTVDDDVSDDGFAEDEVVVRVNGVAVVEAGNVKPGRLVTGVHVVDVVESPAVVMVDSTDMVLVDEVSLDASNPAIVLILAVEVRGVVVRGIGFTGSVLIVVVTLTVDLSCLAMCACSTSSSIC